MPMLLAGGYGKDSNCEVDKEGIFSKVRKRSRFFALLGRGECCGILPLVIKAHDFMGVTLQSYGFRCGTAR